MNRDKRNNCERMVLTHNDLSLPDTVLLSVGSLMSTLGWEMVLHGVVARRGFDFDLALAAQTSARSEEQGRDDGKEHD